MIIAIDFKNRVRVAFNETEAIQLEIPKQDMFSHFDQSIEFIKSRFGSEQPSHGPIYKQSFKTAIFDTYGYGNVHNSIHQYKGPSTEWNRPMPFPADLRAIEAYFKKNKGKVLKLGSKSDPFMWIDQRYSITKYTLELANKYNVQLMIETMSDLCAHEEYIDLIKSGSHTITMLMGFEEMHLNNDKIERLVSPGAPSLLRRNKAVEALKSKNIEVIQKYNRLSDLTLTQKQEFSKRTGIGFSDLK